MKIKIEDITGKKFTIESLTVEIDGVPYIPAKKKYKRWRAERYKSYWRLHATFCEVTDIGDQVDDFNYETGNYFKTKEEAKLEFKKRKAILMS